MTGADRVKLSDEMCLPESVGLPFALEAQVCFICSLIMLCGPVCFTRPPQQGGYCFFQICRSSELAVGCQLAAWHGESRGES